MFLQGRVGGEVTFRALALRQSRLISMACFSLVRFGVQLTFRALSLRRSKLIDIWYVFVR